LELIYFFKNFNSKKNQKSFFNIDVLAPETPLNLSFSKKQKKKYFTQKIVQFKREKKNYFRLLVVLKKFF